VSLQGDFFLNSFLAIIIKCVILEACFLELFYGGTMKAGVIWKESLKFDGFNDKNDEKNSISIDGPTPKHLYLQAIAGCTAMDVLGILEKMRAKLPEQFSVAVDADLTDDMPKVFSNFRMHYTVKGKTPPEKLKKAVEMSQEKYCGVSAMAKKVSKITYQIELNGEII
jgi:putative redox protein